ncbi:MAG TPA: hypothetical protein ENO36_00200 [Fervidicoccus fontis]|uniref:Calcineurin-like phosphoesterase domain-containing protein n=1 Tax=Fervidicoccus fontis TaxID=683846 RepID=A0A7C2UTK2_9CREN|nr:MAG: hypothetical protein C0179_06360 [Fervidicoccus sp.]HEU97263.1 hypothetical protein [Fervidicoccus fontis]
MGLRIVQVGDIHCDIAKLRALKSALRGIQLDLLAVHGDVECDGEILEVLKEISPKIAFVPGNMDDVGVSKLFSREGFNIDSRVIEFGDYAMFGIGGLSFYSSYSRVKEMMPSYRGKKILLLTHHPPLSEKTDLALGRIHAGLPELRELDEEFRVYLHMHGHIHESPGWEFIGETLVVNPGALKHGRYAYIYLEERKVELLRIDGDGK